MSAELTQAHIVAQERLRDIIAGAVAGVWASLPGYDDTDVPEFVAAVAPLVLAGQRQAVLLADAFVARALERPALGLDPEPLTGPAARAGVPADEQWRRPFVTAWTALAAGTDWRQAIDSGGARARSMAATDVQLSHRAALDAIQTADPLIRGWQRRADAGACAFCRRVDGALVRSASAAPLHPGCGCGFEPRTDPVAVTPAPAGVVVHEHGELGPVLADPAHAFTGPSDLT